MAVVYTGNEGRKEGRKEGAPADVTSFPGVFLGGSSGWSRYPCRRAGSASGSPEPALFSLQSERARQRAAGDVLGGGSRPRAGAVKWSSRSVCRELERQITGWVKVKRWRRSETGLVWVLWAFFPLLFFLFFPLCAVLRELFLWLLRGRTFEGSQCRCKHARLLHCGCGRC